MATNYVLSKLNIAGGVTNSAGSIDAQMVVITNASGQIDPSFLPLSLESIKRQIFSTSGTYTPSTGMAFCIVECWGGGGGGSGALNGYGAGAFAVGGGGASGQYAAILLLAATIGASQVVTIGAGGLGGIGASTHPTAGGTTSLGSLCIAYGGGADYAIFQDSGSSFQYLSGGGAPSTSTPVGTIYYHGYPGCPALVVGSGQYAPCPNGGGPNGGRLIGNGSTTLLGFNGTSSANGVAGGYGGGGSGAYDFTTTGTSVNGGAGGAGYMVITEYCTE